MVATDLGWGFEVHPKRGVMEFGSVKWFNNAKGWGFISREDGSDVFVHYSQITGNGYRTLRQGQQVEYELKEGPRGRFAENVRSQTTPDGRNWLT